MAQITKVYSRHLVEQHGREHVGVFTWDVDSDLFFADQALARIFEIDPHEAERGLPLMTFLNRIHPDDRARAAKSIHDTILSGGPCQQDYRIVQRQGPPIDVMAFGRCFKGRNGGATHYAGVVQPIAEESVLKANVRSLCEAAHFAASQAGQARVADHLANAIAEFDTTGDDAPGAQSDDVVLTSRFQG